MKSTLSLLQHNSKFFRTSPRVGGLLRGSASRKGAHGQGAWPHPPLPHWPRPSASPPQRPRPTVHLLHQPDAMMSSTDRTALACLCPARPPLCQEPGCRDYFSSCKQVILPFPPPFPVMQPSMFIKGDWWWGKKSNMQNTSQYPYKHTFICIIILDIITMTFALVCKVLRNTWK